MNNKLANVVVKAMDKKADSSDIYIPNTGVYFHLIGTYGGIVISGGGDTDAKGFFETNKELSDVELDKIVNETTNEIKALADEFGKKIEKIMKDKGLKKEKYIIYKKEK